MQSLAKIVALSLVVLTAVAHGRWTGRWGVSRELERAVSRLGRIPDRFGDWEGGAAVELDERQIALAEIDGYLARCYRDRRDGDEVIVLLVCGRPGPISLHTPDVCYRGRGYAPADAPSDRLVSADTEGKAASFKAAAFHKERSAVPDSLIIYWSWNGEGSWETPKDPRMEYASGRALYKLYVIRAMASDNERRESEICEDFLRQFVPELERSLSAGAPSGQDLAPTSRVGSAQASGPQHLMTLHSP